MIEGVLGPSLQRPRARRAGGLVQRRGAQPHLPGRRPRVVPRRGVLGTAGRDAPRGPGAARGRGVRLHRRAVLLLAHASRLRGADEPKPGTVRDGRRRAGRPGDAGEPAADAGLLRQRLRRLQHRPAVGRDLLPHLRKADADLQGLLPDAAGATSPDAGYLTGRGVGGGRRDGSSSSSTASSSSSRRRPAARSTGTPCASRCATSSARPTLRREAIDLCKRHPGAGHVLGLDRQHRPDQLPARQPGARRLLRRRSRPRSSSAWSRRRPRAGRTSATGCTSTA